MESAYPYDILHGHYSVLWPPSYLAPRTQMDITATLSVSVQRPILSVLKSCVVFVSYCIHVWVEIPIHQQNYVLSSQPSSFLHKYGKYIDLLVVNAYCT